MASTETDAIAFFRKGKLLDEMYANGWDSSIRHQPWSVTKSFVSALIGIAHDEGRFRSISEPIERYVPELTGTAWDGTTIRNLLEMESGIYWDEDTPVLALNTQVEQWVQLAFDYYTEGALGQTRNEYLASMRRVASQGTEFSYNSANTQVLAWMLENIYERDFNEILSRKIWKPMGMATDALVLNDRVGDTIASQGLYSRIYDLGRFGELYRLGGKTPFGKRIVSKRWVKRSTRMTRKSDGDYAFQWWRGPTKDSFEAYGFQGQKISVSPRHCLVGVKFSHTLGADFTPGGEVSDPDNWGFEVDDGYSEWNAAYRAVARHLGKCPRRARP